MHFAVRLSALALLAVFAAGAPVDVNATDTLDNKNGTAPQMFVPSGNIKPSSSLDGSMMSDDRPLSPEVVLDAPTNLSSTSSSSTRAASTGRPQLGNLADQMKFQQSQLAKVAKLQADDLRAQEAQIKDQEAQFGGAQTNEVAMPEPPVTVEAGPVGKKPSKQQDKVKRWHARAVDVAPALWAGDWGVGTFTPAAFAGGLGDVDGVGALGVAASACDTDDAACGPDVALAAHAHFLADSIAWKNQDRHANMADQEDQIAANERAKADMRQANAQVVADQNLMEDMTTAKAVRDRTVV